MFTSYVKNKDSQDSIIFGDGNQGKVKGLGKIAISSEHSISNVFLVESLGYNLVSVSQLCNMGYNCLFTNVDVSVFRRSDGSLAFKGVLDGKCNTPGVTQGVHPRVTPPFNPLSHEDLYGQSTSNFETKVLIKCKLSWISCPSLSCTSKWGFPKTLKQTPPHGQ
jgi:hypothetical protein